MENWPFVTGCGATRQAPKATRSSQWTRVQYEDLYGHCFTLDYCHEQQEEPKAPSSDINRVPLQTRVQVHLTMRVTRELLPTRMSKSQSLSGDQIRTKHSDEQ